MNNIKNLCYLFIISLSSTTILRAQETENLTRYVDPNIGTAHSRYFFYTPAALPFGMAKLAPSTNGSYGNPSGWEAVGYDERHQSIEGFPNFHEFQIGGIVFAPTTGTLQTRPGKLEEIDAGYRSRFDKKDEHATAGYYRVYLKDYKVTAELTATERVGYHRYTFPATDSANIIFDIGHQMGESGPVVDAAVHYDKQVVKGYVVTKPAYVQKYQENANVTLYFYAELDKKPKSFGTFVDSLCHPGQQIAQGKGVGTYLRFDTHEGEQVNIKVGLSYTSVDNARKNLIAEASNLSFDEAKQRAYQRWNQYLSRIRVNGGKKADKIKFYTGLFHALLGRGLASDVNGSYPKNNGSMGQIPLDEKGKPIHAHYNTDAIWGAFWNLTQLWSIAYPEYYEDWIQSQLLVYKDAGWLGDGIATSKYVSGVGTNFTGLAIAAAYNVGLRNYDIALAYEAVRKNELESEKRIPGAGKLDVGVFVKKGFSPYIPDSTGKPELNRKGSPFGASHTLEYAFSSFAAAQFAKSLGKEADFKTFSDLANAWKTLYDPSTKFIRPKDETGHFLSDFDPFAPWRGFQEGNAWQYTFYVPHDPKGLVNLIGKKTFNHRLDSIFRESQKNVFGGGREIDAFAGIQGLYNHGNQPNLHVAWLFHASGRPDLTQKWVHAICNEFYGTDGIHGYGYGQDEDQGQLGAWYVLAGMGLFDVAGLTAPTPSLQIGTPLFDEVIIHLPPTVRPGKFIITTKRIGQGPRYTKAAKLNGRSLNTLQLPFEALVKGGTLELNLVPQP
ncbi:GH92 family glycosyl hydrolase [Olivibacter sp. XZL3]|uniref:GH92 family glycosyl hydrolase n=1 Tax=Olivibacter sp. XZL3 TaxID=1735116 RepID=UPI001065F779|nr:GH92 family glycosyl hydrolase [Olivibacter sp. XZL3]